MTLYDRPVWQLVQDALKDIGDTFTANAMVKWFASKYPRVNPKTIRQHLRGMSANDSTKQHMPSLRQDVFFKLGRSQYRAYDADKDGLFDERGLAVSDDNNAEDEATVQSQDEGIFEFSLEAYLEDFIQQNWNRIDFGSPLNLLTDEAGQEGRQFSTSVGVIDFLCQDANSGDLVVVELKKGKSSDAVIGQCQRYMGWVSQHLAKPDQNVRGLIIAADQDERLRYALLSAHDISIRCFRVDFELYDPNNIESPDG